MRFNESTFIHWLIYLIDISNPKALQSRLWQWFCLLVSRCLEPPKKYSLQEACSKKQAREWFFTRNSPLASIGVIPINFILKDPYGFALACLESPRPFRLEFAAFGKVREWIFCVKFGYLRSGRKPLPPAPISRNKRQFSFAISKKLWGASVTVIVASAITEYGTFN